MFYSLRFILRAAALGVEDKLGCTEGTGGWAESGVGLLEGLVLPG